MFSTTGGGHYSCTIALRDELLNNPHTRVDTIDLFLGASAPHAAKIVKLYDPISVHAPLVWRILYHMFSTYAFYYTLDRVINKFLCPPLMEQITLHNSSLVVFLHPLLNLLYQSLSKFNVPTTTVVTDLTTFHRTWANPKAKMHYVATIQAKSCLKRYGISEELIEVTGLPVGKQFTKVDSDIAIAKRRSLGLDPDKFTVTIMGGRYGAGAIEKIIKALIKSKLNVQMIVICGANAALQKKALEIKQNNPDYGIYVTGLTTRVHEFMQACDIVITKAGPSSLAEAISCGKPVVISSYLPGQEEGNVEFIVKNHLGIYGGSPNKIVEALTALIENKDALNSLCESVHKTTINGTKTIADSIAKIASQN